MQRLKNDTILGLPRAAWSPILVALLVLGGVATDTPNVCHAEIPESQDITSQVSQDMTSSNVPFLGVGSLRGQAPGLDSRAFFSHGVATSVFSAALRKTLQNPLHFLPAGLQDEEAIEEEEEIAAIMPPRRPDSHEEEEEAVEEKTEEETSKSSRIIKEFGNPDEPPELLAQKDAPKPLQGLFKALQSGDRELAFRYAKQHVQFNLDLQDRGREFHRLHRLAQIEAGIAKPTYIDPEAPDYEGINSLLEGENTRAERLRGGDQSYGRTLNSDAHKALLAAEAAEPKRVAEAREAGMSTSELAAKLLGESEQALKESEKDARARIRKDYQYKLSADPKGKVTVFHFYQHRRTQGGGLQRLEKLYQKYKEDPKVVVVALSIDAVTKAQIKNTNRIYKVEVPIRSGKGVAAELGVTDAPTTVIFSPSSEFVWIEPQMRQWYEIDEMIQMVKGEKKSS